MPPENRLEIKSYDLEKDNTDQLLQQTEISNESNGIEKGTQEKPPPRKDTKDAWFTLFVVFLVNVLLGLNWIAFSVFYIYFTKSFESQKSTTGWIGSIQVGVTQMFGLIISPLVSRHGCRATAFTGSIIVTVAMFFSVFAMRVWHLHLTYGLLAGIGLCMLYISNAVVLQQQFRYNRALAAGIGMSGLSLGSTLGSPVTEFLTEQYGWRGALLMHSAIIAHCLCLTLLYKAPAVIQSGINNNKNTKDSIESKDLIVTAVSKDYLTKDKSRSFWSHLCEFSLLKNVPFTLFCLAYLLLMINSSAFWYHLQSRAVYYGIPISQASYLTSFLAFAIFISRIIFSFVANCQCSNTILLFTVGCFIGATSSFMLPLVNHYVWMAGCAIVFGCHIGCAVTVITVSAVYLVGVEHIARGQAFINFSYGIAALVSTPFAGFIVDVSGDYNLPFWINGSVALGGSVLACCSFITSRHKLHDNRV